MIGSQNKTCHLREETSPLRVQTYQVRDKLFNCEVYVSLEMSIQPSVPKNILTDRIFLSSVLKNILSEQSCLSKEKRVLHVNRECSKWMEKHCN